MDTIFDLANICAGLVLGISVLKRLNVGAISSAAVFFRLYRWIIGAVCLILGIYFLLKPGYIIHDVVGILAGLLMLGDRLLAIPAVGGFLKNASKALLPYEAIIGIAALIVGILGLLNTGPFA
jgi:hypothetical protein